MKLFGKKKEIRFETITIDRERDVFRALEKRGWTLCSDPFQFDIQKSHEKLRKDAMKMARELDAELLVEVWDPIYQRMHWKGLKYSAWRKATPQELMERQKVQTGRPDYSDSFASYDTIAQKLEQKKIHISQEEVRSYDSVLQAENVDDGGEVYGNSDEDMGMRTEHIETMSSFNPYDHQGESQDDLQSRTIDKEAASKGPMFESDMQLETGAPDVSDPTRDIDPLAMMMDAAGEEPATPVQQSGPQVPQVAMPAQPPATPPPSQPPAQFQPPSPPMQKPPSGPPQLSIPGPPPMISEKPTPPATQKKQGDPEEGQ
ncbi:MAG: hypothetical protein ACMUHB_02385 [Thermoplasmatota archaeon]